ncbi:MAG: hypothetical protein RL210_2374 [Pseudomonadota bacterium]
MPDYSFGLELSLEPFTQLEFSHKSAKLSFVISLRVSCRHSKAAMPGAAGAWPLASLKPKWQEQWQQDNMRTPNLASRMYKGDNRGQTRLGPASGDE